MALRIKTSDRITICGVPGTGKTTLAKYLASLVEPDLLIYDPLGQYDRFPDECRYIPRSDSLQEFDQVCRGLCARSHVTFFIEEAERYLGQGKPLGPYTFDVINRGRNWGIGIVAVTRRIQRLSKDFFDLSEHHFFFRCGLTSRDYISDLIGRDLARVVVELPQFYFLYYRLQDEYSEIVTLKLEGVRPHLEELEEKGEKPPSKGEEKEISTSTEEEEQIDDKET